ENVPYLAVLRLQSAMMAGQGTHCVIPVFILQLAVATQKLCLHHRCPGIVQVKRRNLQLIGNGGTDLWGKKSHNRDKHYDGRDGNPSCRASPPRDSRLSDAID